MVEINSKLAELLNDDNLRLDIPTKSERNMRVFTLSDIHADLQELASFITNKMSKQFTDTEKAAKVMLAAALYFYGQEDINLSQLKELFDDKTREDITILRNVGFQRFMDGDSPINIAMRAFECVDISNSSKSNKELVDELERIVS